MDNLEELKQINDDLPFTKFPDEIDEYTPFSDADDNINNMITRYRTLLKQGNITEANTIYQEYNLGSYIIGAKFLNKIQHMIIACERAISSVKKYFTFSINEPVPFGLFLSILLLSKFSISKSWVSFIS